MDNLGFGVGQGCRNVATDSGQSEVKHQLVSEDGGPFSDTIRRPCLHQRKV